MWFQMIELPSDEPVQYVGTGALEWGKAEHPSVGFVPVDEKTLHQFGAAIRMMCQVSQKLDEMSEFLVDVEVALRGDKNE